MMTYKQGPQRRNEKLEEHKRLDMKDTCECIPLSFEFEISIDPSKLPK